MTEKALPEVILFDLDDTIIAHTAPGEECMEALCRRFAPHINGVAPERLLQAVRETSRWYWGDPERHRRGRLDLAAARREMMGLAFSSLGIDDEDTSTKLADAYTTEREEGVKLFPGALETLEECRRRGIRLGLVTNGASRVQRKKIEKFGLEPFFECIAVEGEFGAGKPDERVFLHVLERLEAEPSQTWMVGDNLEWDIAGAEKLGIYTVWVDWRGQGLPEQSEIKPDRIVRAISELVW